MTKKLAALKSALGNATPEAAPEPTAKTYTAPSRDGKAHVGAWLSMGYKSSINAILVKYPTRTKESLIAEALNDLFTKYNVTVVRQD